MLGHVLQNNKRVLSDMSSFLDFFKGQYSNTEIVAQQTFEKEATKGSHMQGN